MASSSLAARILVACLSGAVLVACTSALGNFTIDDSQVGDGGKEGGGTSAADGSFAVVDGGGTTDGGAEVDANTRPMCGGGTGHFIFVTSDTWPGNFGGTVAPIATATALCKAAAKAGNLPGTYNAWLSTGATQMPGDILTVPLFLPDCTPVIKNITAYKNSQGNLDHGINQDQFGKPVAAGPAWTATKWDGTFVGGSPTEQTCGNWNDNGTVTQAKGVVGNVGAQDDKWSDANQVPCSTHAHLYCVQVK